ncbi:hypothetical protein INR49_016793 [Caranx melampygus]|nr:hypothetical protein INR49_016793 [Caranx melampygus]
MPGKMTTRDNPVDIDVLVQRIFVLSVCMYGSAEFRWMDAPSQPGFLFLLCSPMPSLSLSLYICVCGWVGAFPGYKSLCHECVTLQKSSSVDIRRRQKGKGRLCLLSPGCE